MTTKETKQECNNSTCAVCSCGCLSPKKAVFGLGLLALIALVSIGTTSLMRQRTVIINFEKVKKEASVYQSIISEQSKYEQKLQAQIDLEFGTLQKEDSELTAKKDSLKPAEYKKQVEALQKKATAAQQKYQLEAQQILAATRIAAEQIKTDVETAVEKVAKSEKAGVVLNAATVVYANDDTSDITDAFIQELNKQIQTVEYPDPAKIQFDVKG